jgi:integrase
MAEGRWTSLEELEKMPKWQTLSRRHSRYLGLSPSLHDDIKKIVTAAIDEIDADDEVKQVLKEWVSWARTRYASRADSYLYRAQVPVMLVAWLGEIYLGRTVTLQDLTEDTVDEDVAEEFWQAWGSKSRTLRSQVISIFRTFGGSAALKKGFRRAGLPRHNPFANAKPEIPKPQIKLVQVGGATRQVEQILHEKHIESWFKDLLAFSDEKYSVFSRYLLATGLRPTHARLIRCLDIDTSTAVKDALGRDFYVAYPRNSVVEYRKLRGARISTKEVPFKVYISPNLAADMLRLCEQNEPDPVSGWTFVFPDLVDTPEQNREGAFRQYISSRKHNSRVKLVDADTVDYRPYAMRYTWTSVVYAITKDLTDLKDLQGWVSTTIPFGHYTKAISGIEALDIAEMYGIFIPPHREGEIKPLLEARAKAATGGDILEHIKGIDNIEDVDAVMQELMKKVDDLKRRSAEAGES